jgi:hypothetical protein
MKRKTYNPYKAKVLSIDRFRGVINPENNQTMAEEYVGSSNNCVSFRIGELTTRDGQIRENI